MPFQNIRNSNPIYILHKDGRPRIEVGQVTNVTLPAPKYPAAANFGQPFQQTETTVDISVCVGEQTANFQKLNANSDIADFGNDIVVSCSREAMNAEIAAMKQRSCDILGSIGRHKEIIAGCEEALSALNPEIAERQRQEADNKALRAEVSELKSMIAELIAEKASSNNPKKKSNDNN